MNTHIYHNLWQISIDSNKIHSIPEIFYQHRKNDFTLYPIKDMMIYCISSDIIILTNKINYNETQETFTLGQNYSENIRHYNLPFLLHLDIHIPSFYKNNQCSELNHVFTKIIQYIS
jgi:hypothetical protein